MIEPVSPSAVRIGDLLLSPSTVAVLSVLRDADAQGAPGHYRIRFRVLAGPAPIGALPVYDHGTRRVDHWTLTGHETRRWHRITDLRELARTLPVMAQALAVLEAAPRLPVY